MSIWKALLQVERIVFYNWLCFLRDSLVIYPYLLIEYIWLNIISDYTNILYIIEIILINLIAQLRYYKENTDLYV